ncbi:hypothetical protein C4D60_Mb09t20290 [Musa balbisiana]|uniref:Uncharacterized protein n=1 Tax=Musa balbisiana TaxID=52838 RepID=A0A4S8IHR3_MUSBA|nr:hypothetical protein C4D60_Mb09t20290 [Musa balbisiana]
MAAASAALRPLFLRHLPTTATVAVRLHPWPLLLPFRSLRSSLPPSRSRLSPVVFAQSNLFKAIQTAWRIGKDVTEAGANLVPDSIPRPLARIGIITVAVAIALFILKSFVSTVFFVLAVMGLVYFVFVSLNTDELSTRSKITTSNEEETLEEARRIMEKYK